jgi:DNA mismatch repair protein MutL
VAVLVDSGAAFERLGFEIDAFGETEVRVSAVPALLAGQNPAELVRELIAERGREGQSDGDVRALPAVDRVFASLACHSARRAGDHLEAEEQRGLLVELDSIPWAPTCPHGRPVVVHFERGEIERRFGRR